MVILHLNSHAPAPSGAYTHNTAVLYLQAPPLYVVTHLTTEHVQGTRRNGVGSRLDANGFSMEEVLARSMHCHSVASRFACLEQACITSTCVEVLQNPLHSSHLLQCPAGFGSTDVATVMQSMKRKGRKVLTPKPTAISMAWCVAAL